MCDRLPTLHLLRHRKQLPALQWFLHCGIYTLTGRTCENNSTPRLKKRRLHDDLLHEKGNMVLKYPENQTVGSSGQTRTTNVSVTLCNWQICHQTHGLCGYTTFGTELN